MKIGQINDTGRALEFNQDTGLVVFGLEIPLLLPVRANVLHIVFLAY